VSAQLQHAQMALLMGTRPQKPTVVGHTASHAPLVPHALLIATATASSAHLLGSVQLPHALMVSRTNVKSTLTVEAPAVLARLGALAWSDQTVCLVHVTAGIAPEPPARMANKTKRKRTLTAVGPTAPLAPLGKPVAA
jgi:hypothetical protein